MAHWFIAVALLTPAAFPIPISQATFVPLLGVCNPDARLDGPDINAVVNCLLNAGPDCACWDLNDNGAVDGPDLPPLVATLIDKLPYANNDRYVAPLNTAITANVLANDLDPFGPGTTALLVTNPSQGVFNFAPDGSLIYTPGLNFTGQEVFTYRAVNIYGVSSPATVFLRTCTATTADCNVNPRDGCETSTTSVTNCGGCGVPCALQNAVTTCATGSCEIAGCNNGYSNCDGNTPNGCEVSHSSFSNACATAESVGQFCGDAASGFLCPATSFQSFASRNGRGSRWFRGRALECSECPASIQARITMQVPAGVNYDLYAYLSCGVLFASSTNGAGLTDQVLVFKNDSAGSQDDYDYWIEVRWVSGGSCSNWTLTFEGRD